MPKDRFRDLDSMGPALVADVGKALKTVGQMIQTEAQISITTDSSSGTETKKHMHEPSKPGEPPNEFTGVLAGHIESVHVEPLKVEVSSNASYAVALEFGTSKMAARPYMVPAAQRVRPEGRKIMAAAVKHALRKHFRK